MYNREHKYVYWREERKKGKWHYIMKSFFMICCALLVGKIIGLFIFGELHTFSGRDGAVSGRFLHHDVSWFPD